MSSGNWKKLDQYLNLNLADCDSKVFENFFLHFLNASIKLTINRNGSSFTREVISAETYAAQSGHKDKGIDLKLHMKGGEIWGVQCKRVKKWTPSQTIKAINKAEELFPAKHYFLVVACNPSADVHDEFDRHPNWSFWNLDKISAGIRERVHPTRIPAVLSSLGLSQDEIRRFAPFATERLVSTAQFFAPFLGSNKLFRHDWKIKGRKQELDKLFDFINTKDTKVLFLISKGGNGKSRLLRELGLNIENEYTNYEVLFLNPHSKDPPEFASLSTPKKRIIIIDDAHRVEQIPLDLLGIVSQDKKAKIIFSTRPQAVEAIQAKLIEIGMGIQYTTIQLPSLKKADIKLIAQEALGENLSGYANELIKISDNNPFLTVIAGDLLRQEKIRWGNWQNNNELRQYIFKAFEEENLKDIPDSDKKISRGILRLIALLAPASLDKPQFIDKVSQCIGYSSFDIEQQLKRLRMIELVIDSKDGVRIAPDLFADFLVYETCFKQNKKLPQFVKKIIDNFADYGSIMLRNLAESAWIARLNNISSDDLLKPLIEQEWKHFENCSFYRRAEKLKHWSSFSIFLPDETLILANKAIKKTEAPKPVEEKLWRENSTIFTHEYVIEQIPKLLNPIAKYNAKCRHETLNLLWQVGLNQKLHSLEHNDSHAWSVIAEVIKYEPKKSAETTLSALSWLETKVKTTDTLDILKSNAPILRILLRSCFDRFVEFTQWEGSRVCWWEQPVNISNTQAIRDQTIKIINYVITKGSWPAVFHALSIIDYAVRGVPPSEAKRLNDNKTQRTWEKERAKALSLLNNVISLHNHVTIRYEVRRILIRNITYGENKVFANACSRLLSNIHEDIILRVTDILLSDKYLVVDKKLQSLEPKEKFNKLDELWESKAQSVANDLILTYSNANQIFQFLNCLCAELKSVGLNPSFYWLFKYLVKASPKIAVNLAEFIPVTTCNSPFIHSWPLLLEDNEKVSIRKKSLLYENAIKCKQADLSISVVSHISRKIFNGYIPTAKEKSIIQSTTNQANYDQTVTLLQLIERSDKKLHLWNDKLLESLTFEKNLSSDNKQNIFKKIIDTLDPNLTRNKKPFKPSIITKLLNQFIQMDKIEVYENNSQFTEFCKNYPKEIYLWVIKRINFSQTNKSPQNYKPVPILLERRFDLGRLKEDKDYLSICKILWEKVMRSNKKVKDFWIELFQAVTIENTSFWLPRLLKAVESSKTHEKLKWLTKLIKFERSLIIFQYPELTRLFLIQSEKLGYENLMDEMQWELYFSCNPNSHTNTKSILNEKNSFLELTAIKATEKYHSDILLNPFYRWIADIEETERVSLKMRHESL